LTEDVLMDGLRPEVDELDRFKNRSVSKTKNEVSKSKPASSSAMAAKKTSSSMPLIFFVLFFVCLFTVFAWFSWKQQIEIVSLKTQLSDASGFMDQSKLLMARLEGRLSETGVELAESGTAAEKKLAFLDSEMRKLWGVAYDRNKSAIEENQAALGNLDNKLSKTMKAQLLSIKNVSKGLESLTGDLNRFAKETGSNSSRLSTEVSVLRTEQEIVSTDLKDSLSAQKKVVETLKKDTQDYLARTAKFDLSIESINASRRQLNERIIDLDKKINALQLKISPTSL
jgi:chromosome segregation ATPase